MMALQYCLHQRRYTKNHVPELRSQISASYNSTDYDIIVGAARLPAQT